MFRPARKWNWLEIILANFPAVSERSNGTCRSRSKMAALGTAGKKPNCIQNSIGRKKPEREQLTNSEASLFAEDRRLILRMWSLAFQLLQCFALLVCFHSFRLSVCRTPFNTSFHERAIFAHLTEESISYKKGYLKTL